MGGSGDHWTTNEIDDHGRFQREFDPHGRRWSFFKLKFRVDFDHF